MMTVTRSCTMSQPIATRPSGAFVSLAISRAFVTTTVDAQERVRPKSVALPAPQSQKPQAKSAPSRMMRSICKSAPGRATPFTARRSRTEKCRPTPTIRSITPTSASCSVTDRSTGGSHGKNCTKTPESR